MITKGIVLLYISQAVVQIKKLQQIQNYGWEPVPCSLLP